MWMTFNTWTLLKITFSSTLKALNNFPANRKRWPNVLLILDRRWRRRTNIKITLCQRQLFVAWVCMRPAFSSLRSQKAVSDHWYRYSRHHVQPCKKKMKKKEEKWENTFFESRYLFSSQNIFLWWKLIFAPKILSRKYFPFFHTSLLFSQLCTTVLLLIILSLLTRVSTWWRRTVVASGAEKYPTWCTALCAPPSWMWPASFWDYAICLKIHRFVFSFLCRPAWIPALLTAECGPAFSRRWIWRLSSAASRRPPRDRSSKAMVWILAKTCEKISHRIQYHILKYQSYCGISL